VCAKNLKYTKSQKSPKKNPKNLRIFKKSEENDKESNKSRNKILKFKNLKVKMSIFHFLFEDFKNYYPNSDVLFM
jgi:hypothetical protein